MYLFQELGQRCSKIKSDQKLSDSRDYTGSVWILFQEGLREKCMSFSQVHYAIIARLCTLPPSPVYNLSWETGRPHKLNRCSQVAVERYTKLSINRTVKNDDILIKALIVNNRTHVKCLCPRFQMVRISIIKWTFIIYYICLIRTRWSTVRW